MLSFTVTHNSQYTLETVEFRNSLPYVGPNQVSRLHFQVGGNFIAPLSPQVIQQKTLSGPTDNLTHNLRWHLVEG